MTAIRFARALGWKTIRRNRVSEERGKLYGKRFLLRSPEAQLHNQDMKITDILRAEHTVFHHLFDHIETTAPRLKTLAEVKSLAMLIDKVMSPHSETEDELFIGPLEHCFEQIGHRDTFHDEHELIEAALSKICKVKSLKDGKRLLLAVIAASRKHFEKEERIVFPLAERVLKAKTLTDLGSEWMKRRKAALK